MTSGRVAILTFLAVAVLLSVAISQSETPRGQWERMCRKDGGVIFPNRKSRLIDKEKVAAGDLCVIDGKVEGVWQ